MIKGVMISIRPQWVRRILSGEKTLEIRKTRPKLQPPFKCYIYCTKGKEICEIGDGVEGNGYVVGEFTCKGVRKFGVPYPHYSHEMDKEVLRRSGLKYEELFQYCGHSFLWAWDISDLEVYDKPKELKEFGIIQGPMSWGFIYG